MPENLNHIAIPESAWGPLSRKKKAEGKSKVSLKKSKITWDLTSTKTKKKAKKYPLVVKRVPFRNTRIDYQKYGEVEAVIHVIWKYLELNQEKL